MKNGFITLLVFAAWVVASGTAFAQDTAKVVGTWDMTLETPQGTRNFQFVLKEENGKLAPSQPFTMAEIKGSDITMKMTVKFQDNDMVITYTGKVEGDAMKGDADFGGFASGSWSAKRKAAGAAAPASAAAPAAGSAVVGDWDMTIDSPQGKRTTVLSVKEESGKLSGKMKNQQGETALDSIAVSGSDITFSITRDIQGQKMVFTYKGKIDGNKMKGEVDFGGMATGAWEAVKK